MREPRSSQRGQTLIIFALVASFVMFALLALVGDYGITLNHFNAIDEAAVLAAQAGAAQVDVPTFVSTGQVVLDQPAAAAECRRVAQADAPFVPYTGISCVTGPDFVEASISEQGQLVVRLLGTTFNIRSVHRSRPAYGTVVPCNGPCA